jgi:pyridoxine 5-phosphate synthase
VHAGHGLTYKTTKMIKKIKNIKELNIGHFIISESIFLGLKQAIINFKNILK